MAAGTDGCLCLSLFNRQHQVGPSGVTILAAFGMRGRMKLQSMDQVGGLQVQRCRKTETREELVRCERPVRCKNHVICEPHRLSLRSVTKHARKGDAPHLLPT